MMMASPFVNEFKLSETFLAELSARPALVPVPVTLDQVDPSVFATAGLLDETELNLFNAELDRQSWVPVGTNGILSDYTPGDTIGSYRASSHEPQLATTLWQRLQPLFPAVRVMDEQSATDWDGHTRWRPTGINPLFRFINYQRGGVLVPHYDAPYDSPEGQRTLVTLILYLRCDPGASGGATRFLRDTQRSLPLAERDYSDRSEFAAAEDVLLEVMPTPGSALLFDHRILHDSEALSGSGCKIIARTDIFFERVGSA